MPAQPPLRTPTRSPAMGRPAASMRRRARAAAASVNDTTANCGFAIHPLQKVPVINGFVDPYIAWECRLLRAFLRSVGFSFGSPLQACRIAASTLGLTRLFRRDRGERA